MNEYNLFDINPEYLRMINNYYTTTRVHITKPRVINEKKAKAKGLHLYQFGEGNTLYAKDDREAIKSARRRGFDINLLKICD